MQVVKPPQDFLLRTGALTLFLAGSIEMNTAEKWQDEVCDGLKNYGVTILNPRRDNWDSSWVQEKENSEFRRQVEWELEGLDHSDIVAFYFDPATKSPVTLMELGLCVADQSNLLRKIIVCCPKGFWRKGNVDIVCDKYNIRQVDTLEELIEEIKFELI